MKRLMFIGPSQCGKTSLTQSLRGEALHYKKTQAIEWSPMAIDTPGEYLENRCLYSALLTSACEADVIALVLNADAQWSPFSPGFTAPMTARRLAWSPRPISPSRSVFRWLRSGLRRLAPGRFLLPAR